MKGFMIRLLFFEFYTNSPYTPDEICPTSTEALISEPSMRKKGSPEIGQEHRKGASKGQ
jgi:hypothetical protein